MKNRFMTPSITYITCAENGLYGLRYLHAKGWHIECVVTISTLEASRFAVSGYVDVSEWCEKNSIPVCYAENYAIKVDLIKHLKPTFLVVNGWNRLIPNEVISYFALGAVGVHAGHPPIGLGRAPLPWNIIKGFADIEVYVFLLTPLADDGNILRSQVVEITSQDSVANLYEKVMHQAAVLFDQSLWGLTAGEKGISQDKKFEIHYPRRTESDGVIDFSSSVENIVNFIRAQSSPYPGAFCFMGREKWRIWSAQSFDRYAFRDVPRIPGRVLLALPSGLVVQTGTSPIWLTSATANCVNKLPQPLENLEHYLGSVFRPEAAPDIQGVENLSFAAST